GVIIKLDNITERKKLIVDLQSSNQLMSAILEETPSVIFIKDVNNDFRYVSVSNEFCTGAAHKTREEIIGFTDYEIFDTETADKFRKDDLEIIKNSHGKVIDVGEETVIRDNVTYSFITKKIILELPNQSQLLIGQTTDITNIRRLNESLIIAKEKAEESDRLKMAFLANMSHEIRTPLNAIIGFSELLQMSEDPAESAEYMNIINVNNELLLRLINDILDLSKMESGSFEIEMSEFDMVKLFREELAAAQNRCSNPNIAVVGECSLSEFVILFDKNRLLQVIKNFVSNAIKYTERGTITIKLDHEDGGIKIAVQDTGIGIDESKHYLVFERFEKLDSFAQGTGLGLAISKAIIATLGGKIGFESKKDVGSTFWAWVPCEQIKNTQSVAPAPMKISAKSTSQNKVKILIAEDIDSNYLLICAFLKDYELTRAYNGQEAVDLCRKNEYDIILMDMKMPVLDGIGATAEIRKFNDTIPIIAVTANAFEQDRKRAKDAGCSGFVAKPVSKVLLIEAINSFI
ncbi:MAG: ATP-binding protein, partial [Phocaeicola sp.]